VTDTTTQNSALYAQLRQARPFAGLSEQQFSSLLAPAILENVSAGSMLIQQGDMDRDYLVLLEGEIEVRRQYLSADGVAELEVGRLFPGQGLGEFAVLFGLPRQASARAIGPSRVLRIDGDRMEELLAWSQHFADDLRNTAGLRTRMNLVRQVAPFRLLPLERVRMAFECMQLLELASGTTVVREGEAGDQYYILETGMAEVWRTDPMTGDTAQVATLGPGDAFGEEALLLGGFRNATVTLTAPARLLTFSKENFDLLMRPLLVAEIDAQEAYSMVQQGKADWLDCRYDIEYDETRIPGATNTPLDKLRELAASLDPNRPYIVYCRSGRRSAAGTFLLRERGLKAYSLIGGVRDWPYALEGEAVGTSTVGTKE